jgi:carboxymethylenebutenolidase
MGELIQLDDAGRQGYLALPAGGVGPGVLVLHAWWGLNDFFKAVCDRLAGEGFIALAPDLYNGKVVSTNDEARQCARSVDEVAQTASVVAGVRALVRQPGLRPIGIGVVGFSMGAAWAMRLAALRPATVAAVVLFYGTAGDEAPGETQAAFLGHFCETDEWEPAETVDALERALQAAGRAVTFHRYPGVGHWFFEANRPDAYAPEAAELAWDRTVAFLHAQLGEAFEPLPQTDADLVDRIEQGWAELQATWAGLPDAALTRRGPAGWSIKDHIGHVTFWENWLLRSIIDGEPAEAVTGIAAETLADIDAVNAIAAARTAEQPLATVLRESATTHEALLTRLRAQPLSAWLQPRFPDDPDERPLLLWIAGNTWGHYEEHIAWIRNLLAA